jgi:hypothetical protein
MFTIRRNINLAVAANATHPIYSILQECTRILLAIWHNNQYDANCRFIVGEYIITRRSSFPEKLVHTEQCLNAILLSYTIP